MPKKFYSVFIPALICVLSLCVFALTACGQNSDGEDNSGAGGAAALCADGVHDYGEYVVQVEPNCYRAGAEYRVCERCNYRDYRETEKTNEHKRTIIPEVKPTCQSNGLTEGERCEDCGEVFVMQQSIERLPHTEAVIPAIEATCTTFGQTEGKKCGVCDEILEKPRFIDDGHSYSAYGNRCTRAECGRLKPIGGLTFELDEETDTYTITKCEDYYVTTAFGIPMFHEGKVVAKIGAGVFADKKIYELEIPESVAEIGTGAFERIEGSTRVKIFGETRIGESAFSHSQIATVEMEKVSYIGKEAFGSCLLVTEIKGVTASVIAEMAFQDCELLKTVELCEGVKEIKSEAFAYTKINSIVIPSSVTSIAVDALDDYSSSAVAYYKGTAEELEEKSQVKGGLWRVRAVYYYSETEPEVGENGEYVGNFWYYDAEQAITVWKK